MIPLKKSVNDLDLYSVFVFPKDEGIDWEATRLALYEKSVLNKKIVESQLEKTKEIFPELTDEQMAQMKKDLMDEKFSDASIYEEYKEKKYDSEIFKGQPLKLWFKTISRKDIARISKPLFNVPVEKLEDEMRKPENKEKYEEYLRTLLHEKIVKTENRDDFTKSEIINLIVTDLSVLNELELTNFINILVFSNDTKKKILPSSVG